MTDTGRMGRAELLARIAELEADNARLAKNHGIIYNDGLAREFSEMSKEKE